jgi:hypothetical protein
MFEATQQLGALCGDREGLSSAAVVIAPLPPYPLSGIASWCNEHEQVRS